MALGRQASMHSPHPLHSFASTRRMPRSRLDAAGASERIMAQLLLFMTLGIGGRPVFQVVRAHREVLQLLLEQRIGDADERFGALPEGLSMQICNSMFG